MKEIRAILHFASFFFLHHTRAESVGVAFASLGLSFCGGDPKKRRSRSIFCLLQQRGEGKFIAPLEATATKQQLFFHFCGKSLLLSLLHVGVRPYLPRIQQEAHPPLPQTIFVLRSSFFCSPLLGLCCAQRSTSILPNVRKPGFGDTNKKNACVLLLKITFLGGPDSATLLANV